jgi:zinc protease
MQVVVVTDRRLPVVSHMVWYRVGAADEAPGQSGLAHLLEHLMFKGTETVAPGDFSRTVARLGGEENAYTSHDFTAYFQTIARDRLETVMRLEADRMRNLKLSDEQVLPERLVVLEERRQRTDNDPAALLAERADATLYLNHPYRRPVIGWAHEIAGLTAADALDFYRRWYMPNNAVLIVAGDASAAEVRALAERFYGVIPAGPTPARLALKEPPPLAARRVALDDERVEQPAWQRSHLAPSHGTGERQQAYALQVLQEVLSGGATSRLYRQLVVDDRIAVAAGASYDPVRRGPGEFVLYGQPVPGTALAAIEAAIDGEITALLRDGVSEAEVARAKERMVAEAVYARDSMTAAGHVIGRALAVGLSVDDVEQWPERIAAVSRDEVNAAARSLFTAPGAVTALLDRKPGRETAANP